MKEPVSLDLFPPDVRARLLFHLGQRWEYYAYFSASSVRDYDFALAYLLDSLGGLGGVW